MAPPVAGDIFDVKNALAEILRGPAFEAQVADIVAEKGDGIMPAMPQKVYTEETYTKLIYPACELVAYQVTYTPDTQAKEGRHRIGARWTVVEATEQLATRAVEILARATVDLLWDNSHQQAGLLADFTFGAGPVTIVEEDYSPLVPRADATFLKSALVVLELETIRD